MAISSNEFTKEELKNLKQWDLPHVADGRSGRASSESVQDMGSLPRLTLEQIERVQKEAYDEAAKKGQKDGYKRGYNAGFQEAEKKGYDAGYEEGQNEIGKTLALWNQLLTSLDQPFAELDSQVEHELATLAMTVAKQIIRRELKLDSGQVIAVVREAIQILPASARKIRLHLHPEDAELVRTALALDETTADWEVVEEPLLTRGGCQVDTDTSRVDATIEKRLAATIAKAFGGEREGDAG